MPEAPVTIRDVYQAIRSQLPEGSHIARELIEGLMPCADEPNTVRVNASIQLLVQAIVRLDEVVSAAVSYELGPNEPAGEATRRP
jgi:hypothetical protein